MGEKESNEAFRDKQHVRILSLHFNVVYEVIHIIDVGNGMALICPCKEYQDIYGCGISMIPFRDLTVVA